MKTLNFNNKIQSYFNCNPLIDHKSLEVLLTIDHLYSETPTDTEIFREIYAHLDPKSIYNSHQGITFLKIAETNKSENELKKELNHYLNIKFNDIENAKPYEDNMALFKKFSIYVSNAIEEILRSAMLPTELINILKEKEIVRSCTDIYQMLEIFKSTSSDRIKYEILRKLGLIVLLARINRSIHVEQLDNEMKKVISAFNKGLGFNNAKNGIRYLWIDHADNVQHTSDRYKAEYLYNKNIKLRKRSAQAIYPIQKINYYSFETHTGNKILNFECRNKFKKGSQVYYASFIEKMIRKNLEFPDQIHDIVGIKIVVRQEEDIKNVIYDLEKFLGGSSTRKREKNTYHRFDKRVLNKYSADNYYVWKAIYDITLSHPSLEQVKKMISITNNNPIAKDELNNRLKFFKENPRDFVIEVQLQDLESYLRSITQGSPTDHRLLKMSQIRNNSFYKLWPKEIYENEIIDLKLNILNTSKINF